MPALFSPRSDRRLRIVLYSAAAVVVGILALLFFYVRTTYITGVGWGQDQPVMFDHRHHVRDDGIDCLYCHHDAERSPSAGIPATSVCMGCHSQIWPDSPLLAPVRAAFAEGGAIAWRRVHDLPDFVYFDHSIHVNKGIGCVRCHGRVDEMPEVFKATPMSMGWCLDCHRDPVPELRPREEVTSMRAPDPTGPTPEELAEVYDVRSETYCTTCHR